MALFKLLRASEEAKSRNKVSSDLPPIILLPGIIGSDTDCAKLKLAFLELGRDVMVWKHPNHPDNLTSGSTKPGFEKNMGAFLSSILTDFFSVLQKVYPHIYAKLCESKSPAVEFRNPTEVKHPPHAFFSSGSSVDQFTLQLDIVGWSMGAIIAEQLGCAARAFIKKCFSRAVRTKIDVVALDSPSSSIAAEELNANTLTLIQRAYAILQIAASEAGHCEKAGEISASDMKGSMDFVIIPGTEYRPTTFSLLVGAIHHIRPPYGDALDKFMNMTRVMQHLWALTARSKFKPTADERVDAMLSISTTQTRENYDYEDDKDRELYAKHFHSVKLPLIILDTKLDHTSIVNTDFASRVAQASVHFFNRKFDSVEQALNLYTDDLYTETAENLASRRTKLITIPTRKITPGKRSRFTTPIDSMPHCLDFTPSLPLSSGPSSTTSTDSDSPEKTGSHADQKRAP